MQYLIAITSIIFSVYIVWKSDELVNNAYKSGFEAGIASAKPVNINSACVAWFFDENMKTVKKRICKK